MTNKKNIETFDVGFELCQRCGEAHGRVLFHWFEKEKPFVDSSGIVYQCWGTCPTTGDPILLGMFISSMVQDEDDE